MDLIEEILQVHRTFLVSHIPKCLVDDITMVPLDNIQVDELLNYVEIMVVILYRNTKALRNKVVDLVNVQLQHRKGFEWTWEPKEEMRALPRVITHSF